MINTYSQYIQSEVKGLNFGQMIQMKRATSSKKGKKLASIVAHQTGAGHEFTQKHDLKKELRKAEK